MKEPEASTSLDSEPSRSVPRALIYGCLVGAVIALLATSWPISNQFSELFSALSEGYFKEFAAGVLLACIYAALAITFGMLLATPTAFPFIVFMVFAERRSLHLQKVWAWGLLGAAFAIPFGLWLASLGTYYNSDGNAEWGLGKLYFNMLCGTMGGVAAWFGYYRPVRSARETLPEQSDRPAS